MTTRRMMTMTMLLMVMMMMMMMTAVVCRASFPRGTCACVEQCARGPVATIHP